MDLKHFLATSFDTVLYNDEQGISMIFETEEYDIVAYYSIVEQKLISYDGYNSLDDSSVLLDELEQKQLVDHIVDYLNN